ncbi:MAG: hypothetical protein HYZ52_00845 [Candidatus Omnitrophica bacterium]|nr:hypothetical protein [Candidatus Omnitrophota bacterium]
MDIHEIWESALKNTEIIRPRVLPLETFAATQVPYLFLSESSVNPGDTVVRRGEVTVEKPSIVLPLNTPQFGGFDFEEKMPFGENAVTNFFLVRGIAFPSFKYNNHTQSIDVFEGRLAKAIEHHAAFLERSENVRAGLVTGPEEAWQFSVLIFVCNQVARSSDNDIRRLWEAFRKRKS